MEATVGLGSGLIITGLLVWALITDPPRAQERAIVYQTKLEECRKEGNTKTVCEAALAQLGVRK